MYLRLPRAISRIALATCFCLALLGPKAATGNTGLPDGEVSQAVMDLDSGGFAAALQTYPMIFVQFYAPWCGHCKQMVPEYEKAAKELLGKIPVVRVDASMEVELATQYTVGAYPTVYFLKHGRPEEYSGARTAKAMVDWVLEKAGPAMKVFASREELVKDLGSRGLSTAFVAVGRTPLQELLGRLAESMRALGSFYFLSSQEGDIDLVEVHRGMMGEVVELTGVDTADSDKVLEFLYEEMLPPFGEVSDQNFHLYSESGSEGFLWVLFAGVGSSGCSGNSCREQGIQHYAIFEEVADLFKQFRVFFVDVTLFKEHLSEQLGAEAFPAVVLQRGNITGEESEIWKYTLQLDRHGITAQVITRWLQTVLDGKIKDDDALEDEEIEVVRKTSDFQEL